MRYRVSLVRRADCELAAAAAYYRRGGPRVANRFAQSIDAAVARAAADPESLPRHDASDRLRRSPVGKFPYDLLFVFDGIEVSILSVWFRFRDPADLPRG